MKYTINLPVFLVILLSFIGYSSQPNTFESERTRQSEMYIKGFKAYYDSLTSQEQKEIVSKIEKYADQLDEVLAQEPEYRKEKSIRIEDLKNRVTTSDAELYAKYDSLFEEYMNWSYDSAFVIGYKAFALAKRINNPNIIVDSKIKLGKMFISGGYFREADQIYSEPVPADLSEEMQIKLSMAKFSLEFENGFFFAWRMYKPDRALIKMTEIYNDLLPKLKDDSYEVYYLKTALAFYKHNYKEGVGYVSILLSKTPKDTPQYIYNLGNVGFIKMGVGDYVGAMEYMTMSSIQAVKSGSNNYSALRRIAELMYVVGDLDRASRYIKMAMENAVDYNSKYRIVESSKGYPIITLQLEERGEKERNTITIIAICLVIVVLALVGAFFYIQKQRKVKYQQAELIAKRNTELEERNQEIIGYNQKLLESNSVTRMLVSRMVTDNAQCRVMIDQLKKDISRKLIVKQYNGIEELATAFSKNFNVMYPDIDEILLTFFPDFVEKFNSIFPQENRIEVPNPTKLPTEMKIFALWRIGVKKNEEIANCLGYSVNTVKSYKTKIINTSGLDKDEFYNRILAISVLK